MSVGNSDVGVVELVFFAGGYVSSASHASCALSLLIVSALYCGVGRCGMVFVGAGVVHAIKGTAKKRGDDYLPYGEAQ